MLLEEFTGFDDVIIVFVTSQPQKFIFKNLTKNIFNKQKNFDSITYQSVLDRGAKVQIICKNSPAYIGLWQIQGRFLRFKDVWQP